MDETKAKGGKGTKQRKAYDRPELIELGSVGDVTEGSATVGSDGGSLSA
jgi:hypothetical protein